MKVILNSDVEKLGRKGDLVEVAAGYARNFLLPRNLAITASRGAVKEADSMRRSRDEKDKKERAVFEQLAERLGSVALKVEARAGVGGHLFGSVTSGDLAEEVTRLLGEDIDRKKITVNQPIKSLGTHTFSIHLHRDVVVQGTVEVVPEYLLYPSASRRGRAGDRRSRTRRSFCCYRC
ncbi:MAG: 50S ribosomal protein L9 [Actinobacteria bacterium]|nr:50S ribosomal protein L9 [Actinomycetota bacterium]